MKNDQEMAPAVVYEDVTHWPTLVLFNLVFLAIIAAEFIWDFSLDEFDVLVWLTPAMTMAMALVGGRRIEVGPSGIRLYRRGRLRLDRPLSDFSHVQPGLLGISFIVLRGGPRIWVPVAGYSGSNLLDYLAMLPQEPVSGHTRGSRRRPDEIELLATDVHLNPEFCVGCGLASDGAVEIEASHGFDLLLVSWGIGRSVALPGCAACRWKRRWLTFTGIALCIATFFLGILGPLLFEGVAGAPLWLPVLLLPFAGMYFLNNWGRQMIDDAVLGISARWLSRDATRVVLRVRKPGVLRELERNQHAARDSRGASAPVVSR